jgi:glycosyltransferase involved in cell wall biosynthesis
MITPYPPDRCGIALYSKDLISKLSRYMEVSVIANWDEAPRGVEDEGVVRVVRCWRRHTLTYFFAIFKATSKERPRVIHVQHEYLVYGARKYSLLFPLLLLMLKLLRRPLIVTMHSVILLSKADESFFYEHGVGHRFAALKRGLLIFMTRLICRLSDMIVVHKELMKRILVNQYGLREEKIRVIPHGVPHLKPVEEAKRRLGLRGLVIAFTGFIIPGKGVETLIRAFSRFLEKQPETTLLIVGGYHPRLRIENPWYLGSIERALRDSGVGGRVIFTNRFLLEDELHLHLSAADVIVLPYTDDAIVGASGALARCASLGKPIIATSIPRFLEDLIDNFNALLVEPGDVDDLVEALERILGGSSLRRRITTSLGRWVSERGWRRVALKTLRLYRELAEG